MSSFLKTVSKKALLYATTFFLSVNSTFSQTTQNQAILFTGDISDTNTEDVRDVYLINLVSNYSTLRTLGYGKNDIHIFFPGSIEEKLPEEWKSMQKRLIQEKKGMVLYPTLETLFTLRDSLLFSAREKSTASEFFFLFDGHGILHTETVEDITSGKSYFVVDSSKIYPMDLDSLFKPLEEYPITTILNYCYSGDHLKQVHLLPFMNVFASDRGTRTIRSNKSDFARTFLLSMINLKNDRNGDGTIQCSEAYQSALSSRKRFLEKIVSTLFNQESATIQKERALPSYFILEDRIVYQIK